MIGLRSETTWATSSDDVLSINAREWFSIMYDSMERL